MKPALIILMQRLNGWRLWLLFSLLTVLAAEAIVSLMDLLLMGRITYDYVLTGLVAAGVVAPASLFLLSHLLQELSRQQQKILSSSVESAEARLRVALDSSDEGVLMVGNDGRVLSTNKRFLELWRVSEELAAADDDAQLLAHVLDQLVDPEGFMAGVRRLYGSDAEANDILHFKDGRVFSRYTRALSLGNEAGRIWCFRDVSEQARAEATLAEREELYRAIVSQAGDGIDLVDVETLRFVEVNDAACRMLGYQRKELVKKPLAMIQADLDEAALREAIAGIQRAGYGSFNARHRCKDGRVLDVRLSVRAISLHGRDYVVGVWRDVTEQNAAQAALAESLNLLKTIIDTAPIRVFWKDRNLRYLGCNPAFARDAGKSDPGELIGKDDYQMGWVEQADLYRADDRAVMASGISRLNCEEPQTTPDGGTLWLSTSKVPLRNERHETIGVLGLYEDITERKKIREVLQASEKRSSELASLLRLMCDNVPDMIWAKDLEHRYLFANKAICQQLLHAVDTTEPVGKNDMFFALRERQSQAHDPLWHTFGELCQDSDTITLANGKPSVFEEFGNVRGCMTYLDVHKAPFLNDRGEIIGTVGSARNITERKQLDVELERHRTHLEELVKQRTDALLATEARASRILESSADGLYGVDVEGRVTFINPAGCALLGYRPEDVIGRSAHDLFHHSKPDGSPFPADECAGRQAWREGRQARVEDVTYWHADGRPVPVSLAVHPMYAQGKVVGAVVSFADMSEQRAAAEARERALVAAENLARARSEFLANMSHEIRTPMNGMLGFAQIGQRNYQNPEKARNAFEKIIASGNQLLGVVNEILDFSKIDAGQLKVEATEMSLAETLERAVELVAERARAKGLELRLEKAPDFPDTCVSDPLRIGQILLNLLSNAVKFTEAGHITLFAARQDGDLVFRVSDTGIGMNDEQLGYVFNPFQQADGSTTRKFGGTGLGLAICKRLLELMHGTIRVESRPGAGSSFEFRVPYVAPGAPIPAAAASLPAVLPERPLSGLSILLAEDDEVNRLMLETNLEEDGARLVMVGDGREAVERVRQDGAAAYDVVLMDIQMPEMDGYEATRRIRELAPGLPIIGQTAHAFAEEREKCYAAGMVAHIAKPIDPQALVRLILNTVSTARHLNS